MGRISLTQRDLTLLNDCYRRTLLSFEQIHRKYFAGRSVPTVSNRLGQLCKAGFLVKTRVNLPLITARKEVGVIYRVTRSTLKVLPLYFPEDDFRELLPALNPSTLVHDLTLNDTLAALERRFPSVTWAHGRLIDWEREKGMRVPDAVLLGPNNMVQMAVEIELTAKSERRYREIILQYQLAREAPKVLYVVATRQIHEKIVYQITQQKELPGLSSRTTGKFYFVSLAALLADPINASMTNGREALTATN